MLFSACADTNDQSLGPNVLGCRGDFDFTVKFEQLCFSLTPAAIFILASPWRVAHLVRKPTIVGAPLLRLAKLGVLVSYASLELSQLILITVLPFGASGIDIISSALRLAAALCMVGLSYFDHSKSPRPSIFLSAYLFFTLLFDVAQARTYWLASSTRPEIAFTAIFTAALTMKVAMLLLEAQRKTKWVAWDSKDHSPEETSGIYTLGVFSWLNKLFFDGYHKTLGIRDLYPLDQNLAATRLSERFSRHINEAKHKGHEIGLMEALAKTLLVPMILPIPAKLAAIGSFFCQPLFISSLTSRLSQSEPVPVNIGYGFIGASICIYSVIAISQSLYWYFQQRLLYMMRACLATAIYTKTTEARAADEDENASLTLMSIDIERIMKGSLYMHELWGNVIEVALSAWLLYNLLGVAFIAPIVVVFICVGGVSFFMRFMGDSQRKWMAGIQKRVGLTSSVIGNMKNIKISGLTSPISRFVQKLRVDELQAGSNFRLLMLTCSVFSYIPLLLLDATKLFTSLSYLLLMSTPLQNLLETLPQMAAAVACLGRIQKFLQGEGRDDYRVFLSRSRWDPEKSSLDKSDKSPAVVIKDGSFGWKPDKMVLNNLDIEIPRASLTIVVGPIASGKSSLCKALLGEMPHSQGTVTIATKFSCVGYCDQTPFLSNGSIRDNIIGYSPFDAQRYAEVVDGTMLGIDFETLPEADRTNIGSNGITLSGGQKQRVSLARCLYLQSDLLIMDDVFSGLDADTEDQVFQRVFGANGILKRRQATVVLCTHSVRHLPSATHVIALSTDGTVVEQGTFGDLVANQSYIHSLGVKAPLTSQADSEKIESDESAIEPQINLIERAPTETPEVGGNDKSRLSGDSAAYIVYMKSMGTMLPVAIFTSGLLYGFFYNFPTIWLTYWSADAVATNPSHSFGYYAAIYAVLEVCAMLSLIWLGVLLYITVLTRSGVSLHHAALRTLIHAPLRFFTTTDQGIITNLFSQDLSLIDNELPSALLNVIYMVFVGIGQAAVIASSSPYLAISYPFLFGMLYVVQKFYLRTSRQLRLLDLEAKSPLYTHFLDTSKGIVTLRAFGFVSEDRAKNAFLLDTSQRPAYLLAMIQQWLHFVLNVVVAIIAVMLTSLAVRLRSNSGFTGASLVTLMSFGEMLSGVVIYYTALETSLGAISRLKAFDKAAKTETKDGEDIVPPEEWPPRGEIILNNVSASYDNDTQLETPTLALKNLRLKIRPGEKIAICGRTGSGKSSLIALLLKLLDPIDETPDCVNIDNTPLSRIDRVTLRQRIIAIPQDIVFLPDGSTFQENLDPSNVSTAADAQAVLEAVDLWDFVRDKGGLEAGMTVSNLSQGQRQLFSLGRAVLRRRIRARSLGFGGGGSEGGILLLDEVSSSVDRETEKAMQEVIRVEFREYTVVAVSHRLDMIMDYDRVVVMEKGEIVEEGNPARLVEEPGTRFGELWSVGGN
ncbi:ABC multidrug transporter [Annulohypoxylon truncatum]|uniref:ABC multidrug transporter n=1 Tax=Annulohypoxylon truncatum TaxID=327061 RepID=UPI002007D4BB|nr:ABC multidrug transporter [Annulohypoxylon truncatum]KAI1208571.1 ABC multidrug transporter [Annulohypoxylon truncatum]